MLVLSLDKVQSYILISYQGCNAEYTIVDERIVGRKPNNLSWEEAAAVPLTGITAWEAFEEQLKIRRPASHETNQHKVILISNGAGGKECILCI